MKDWIKPISVGFILLYLLAMHVLKIDDPELRYVCFAIISTIFGWHFVTNFPYSPQQPSSKQ